MNCPKCQVNVETDEHTCPFREDVDNDSETLCNCCSQCEHECMMDI